MSLDTLNSFQHLLQIMDELREKCPWDREQTLESIRQLTIEETYELSEAILSKNMEEIKKELGDLLLHIVFYSKIASESQTFSIKDVIDSLCAKLIRRHPHIYGNVDVENSEQVKQNWEQIKLAEKGNRKKSILEGVPSGMPSLVKAYRLQEKAATVGFDWPTTEQVIDKLQEEIVELKKTQNQAEREKELGDILFSIVNYARHENLNPDNALEYCNLKFKKRFEFIENKAQELGKELTSLSLEEMELYWQDAKKTEI